MVKILLEIILFLFLTIIKFLFVPYTMLEVGYQIPEIIFIHSSGAAFGVYLFYNFGDLIFSYLNKKKKKAFSKRTRWIINIKNKYGLRGLLLISGIISVPIASLLGARYFKSNTTMAYLVMGFFFWSVGLTFFSYLIFILVH